MNIKTTNEITNGIFSTTVTITEFGSDMLTSEEELNLLDNYSCKLRYKNLNFVRYFKKVDNELVFADESEEGVEKEKIELVVTDVAIPVDKYFKAEYKIALNKIKDSDVTGDVITTKESMCEAKCKVFADEIKEGLKAILEEIRNKTTSFEGTTEEMI